MCYNIYKMRKRGIKMKNHLSFLLALLFLLVGCGTGNEHSQGDSPAVVEEATAAPTTAPTVAPTVTPELTAEPSSEPTLTPEPLHLTREDVEKYRDCVVMPEGYSAPEYLIVTHPDGTISAGLMYDLFEAENWRDVVAISGANSHVAGLKVDGTLCVAGNFDPGSNTVLELENVGIPTLS